MSGLTTDKRARRWQIRLPERHPAREGPYAQFGEDEILAEIFADKTGGRCVGVGAFDGITGSATLRFEQAGWDCLLVEPNPAAAEAARRNGRARVAQCAASSSAGHVELLVAPDAQTSRLISHAAPFSQGGAERLTVDACTLEELLDEAGFSDIDFMTIDVEGHELDALKGIDLARRRPRIVIVEENENTESSEVSLYLGTCGYVNFKRTGVNDWYARADDPGLISAAVLRAFRIERRLLRVEERLVPVLQSRFPGWMVSGLRAISDALRKRR